MYSKSLNMYYFQYVPCVHLLFQSSIKIKKVKSNSNNFSYIITCSCSVLFFPSYVCSAFDYDTENMNSEDIYSSLKGVTEAIQNFSVRSQEDMNEPVQRREGEEVSRVEKEDVVCFLMHVCVHVCLSRLIEK